MKDRKVSSYEFGEFRLDVVNGKLLKGDVEINITRKSMEVLRFFVENRGKVLSKEVLLESLWDGVFVEEKTLMQYIYMLRKALNQNNGNQVFIKTVSKTGYNFVAPVRVIFSEDGTVEMLRSNEAVDLSQNPGSEKSFWPFKISGSYVFAAALVIALVVSFASVYTLSPTKSSVTGEFESVAVLPFTTIGEDKDEKLGLGIADILISKLGESKKLMVTPTSSIIRYTGDDKGDLFALGDRLGVDALVDGTIQSDGDTVRAVVRLYDVSKRRQIWSGSFDAKYRNVFAMQDVIGGEISRELYVNLNQVERVEEIDRFTDDIEAYQAYLDGLFYWNQRSGSKPGSSRSQDIHKKAIESFERSVRIDPEFALARAYLSDTYALVNHFRMYNLMPPDKSLSKARLEAEKAIEINPNSSEALAALAFVYNKEGKKRQSRELLKKAITIKPNNANARKLYAWQLLLIDEIDLAVSEMRIAQRLDPQSATINIALGQILNFSREPQKAIIYAQNALRIAGESNRARLVLVDSHEQMRDLTAALDQTERILKVNENDKLAKFSRSRILAKLGKKSEAKELFDELLSHKPHKTFYYSVARVHLALGEVEKTYDWIQKKGEEDPTNYFYYNLKHDHDLDTLRGTRRFQVILEREQRVIAAKVKI